MTYSYQPYFIKSAETWQTCLACAEWECMLPGSFRAQSPYNCTAEAGQEKCYMTARRLTLFLMQTPNLSSFGYSREIQRRNEQEARVREGPVGSTRRTVHALSNSLAELCSQGERHYKHRNVTNQTSSPSPVEEKALNHT